MALDLSLQFGGVAALRDVSFAIDAGEIRTLMSQAHGINIAVAKKSAKMVR